VNPVGTILSGPIGVRAHTLLYLCLTIYLITLLRTPFCYTTSFTDIIIISIIIIISTITIIIIFRVAYFRLRQSPNTKQ
jgi:hypothetical protein